MSIAPILQQPTTLNPSTILICNAKTPDNGVAANATAMVTHWKH